MPNFGQKKDWLVLKNNMATFQKLGIFYLNRRKETKFNNPDAIQNVIEKNQKLAQTNSNMSEEEKKSEGGQKEGPLFAQKQASILGQQHNDNKHQQNAHSRLGKVFSNEKNIGKYFRPAAKVQNKSLGTTEWQVGEEAENDLRSRSFQQQRGGHGQQSRQ